jgi:hypothetical protein
VSSNHAQQQPKRQKIIVKKQKLNAGSKSKPRNKERNELSMFGDFKKKVFFRALSMKEKKAKSKLQK